MREKVAKRQRKSVNCLPKQLPLNGSFTMFTQTLCEAIKRFLSHFPREFVHVEKTVTVNLDFFSCTIFQQIQKKSRVLDLALL